jgi:LuxR family maltose regulon positive regulatory protein
MFVNALSSADQELVLVLDDYHLLSGAEVHESMRTLLEHAPHQLHLVISTRTDPPLPTSRLRIAGQLLEIRAEQLRFTVDEAAELLALALGAPLADDDVARLVTRTEGWAAGLQLAGLRLSDRPDPDARREFIARFTGADRHLVDYLGEEVLAAQPPDVRDFLLRTSIAERICAELANAITGRVDGARMLDRIQRANLFLTPLDEQQHWFRYHQLFREILQQELNRLEPMAAPDLHARAARWFASTGRNGEAVGHALASGDVELAAGLVADAWRTEFNRGHLATVRGWLAALPPARRSSDQRLVAAQVWLALDAGRLDDAEVALASAEGRRQPLDVHLHVLRALHTFKSGDLRGALAMLEPVGGSVTDPFLRTVHDLITGVCRAWLDEGAAATAALTATVDRAREEENLLAQVYAKGMQGLVAIENGDLEAGKALLTRAERLVTEAVGEAHFVAMFPALAAARLALLRRDSAAATATSERAVELARRGAGRLELAAALLTRAAAGEPGGPALAEAREVLYACRDHGPVLGKWLRAEQLRARPGETAGEQLTEREQAILTLLPGPMTQRELAGALFVTPNTLKTHLRAIYRKLGADSRLDAVHRARERGLL